jgi:adenosylcobinamide kinase / adenosylcobinamide-phosphate guanylyltransferase
VSSSIVTITGGARSGKSAHASKIAANAGMPVVYLATASPSDAEMAGRIEQHRAERPSDWRTIEEPFALSDALSKADLQEPSVILVDCLTVWLGGYICPLYDLPEPEALESLPAVEEAVFSEAQRLCDFARDRSGCLIVVTNEVGDGIVPADPLTRFYRDALGRLNQNFAAASDEVYLLVAGLPVRLK